MVTIYETEINLGMKDYLEKVQSLKYGDGVFNIPGYGKDNLRDAAASSPTSRLSWG